MPSSKGITKEIMADPSKTVMLLSIPTTELAPGLELVCESAKNLCQEMLKQPLSCVCLTAFFPVVLAAERLFDMGPSVRWCKKLPHFLVRTTLLKTEKFYFKKPHFLTCKARSSCNSLSRAVIIHTGWRVLHLERFQGNIGKHPALQLKVAHGHSGCRLLYFCPISNPAPFLAFSARRPAWSKCVTAPQVFPIREGRA